MCGIVGYVGEKQARDVVIEGLRRLEYRGYDSAGIAVVSLPTDGGDNGSIASTSAPASWPTSRRRCDESALPPATTGIGHTRWATHGAPNDDERAPAPRPDRPGRRGAQRDHRELRRAARPSSSAEGHDLRSETDTEVAAHLLEDAVLDDRRPHRGDAAGLPPAGGRLHPASPSTARTPRRVVGRAAQLAAGRRPGGRARTSSAPTSRPSSSTPATRSSSARTRSSRSPATTSRSPTSTGNPAQAQPLPRRLGRLRRREGRLRLVHAQGDRRAAALRRRHPARPAHRER